MKQKELPDGWLLTTINDVILETKQISPATEFPNDTFQYIDISSIDSDIGKINSTRQILGKDAPSRAKQVIQIGDLLISTVRPNLNTVALVPDELDNQICSTGFCILRADRYQIIPEYLFYISRTNFFIQSLVKRCKGANYPAVSNTDVKSLIIPLPPLETQKKLVAILEKAEQIQRLHAEVDEHFDELIKSIFIDMFGNPMTNPKGWEIGTIEECCELVTDGEHNTPRRSEDGIYLLSARNIQNHSISLTDVDFIDKIEYQRISKRIIPKRNDILISCSGTIGRVTRVREDFPFQMVRSVALIRPILERIRSIYLEYVFDTNYVKYQINQLVNQSSQANLFQGKIRKIKIPIPNMEYQEKFVKRIELIEDSANVNSNVTQQNDILFNSLIQKAFKGELVK